MQKCIVHNGEGLKPRLLFRFFVLLLALALSTTRDGIGSDAVQLADLNPGSGGSFPSNLTVFASSLFFNAYTLSTGRELWKTDGTNITLVADINDTSDDIGGGVREGNDSLPTWLTPFNGSLYFSAFDSRRGAELWKYDGTNVTRAADINPDASDTIKLSPNSSWPSELTVSKGALYFSASNNSQRTNFELWKYDGATATMVTNIHADTGSDYGSYPRELYSFTGSLYFMADNGVNGFELWRYNGTNAVLIDINPGAASAFPEKYVEFQDKLFFRANRADTGYELFNVNGTNVTVAADINPGPNSSFPDYFTVFKSALYLRATGPTGGSELWKFDGTNAVLAADINASGDSFPKNLTVFGDQLCFAADDGVHGWELWKYDGTNANMVADLNPAGDSFPEELTVLNGLLYFTATTPDTGYELFKYDGTNVTIAADMNPGPGDSFPQMLTVFENKLFFRAAGDGMTNWEIWRYTPPVTSAPPPPPPVDIKITGAQREGDDLRINWITNGGSTNVVQAASEVVGPFQDISAPLVTAGSGAVTNTFVDVGAFTSAATNRFYRIKQP
jgi:ELWxxDGT repeat protein